MHLTRNPAEPADGRFDHHPYFRVRPLMRGVMRFSFTTMKVQLVLTILFVMILHCFAHTQERSATCKSPPEYGNRNQVDPKRSTVRGLSGRIISEVGDPAKEMGPVPACVGLFTEQGHRLVASVVADEDGRFRFAAIPSGRFRLIVRDPLNVFCLANMPLRIVSSRGKGTPLVIHMRASGIDICSYGAFK